MKNQLIALKVAIVMVMTAACSTGSSDGTYVATWRNEFSIAEDTLIVKGDIIIKRTGYHKIRNGQVKPKKWSYGIWRLQDPNSPIIVFNDEQVIIGSVTYKKIKL